jgi:hypothetical protein
LPVSFSLRHERASNLGSLSHPAETGLLIPSGKCCQEKISPAAGFTSRGLSLFVNQVVFVSLMYSLLQWYWQRIRGPEFNPRTTARALDQLRPTMTVILIFYQGLCGLCFSQYF